MLCRHSKNAFRQQVLCSSIFPHHYLKFLKVLRKSEADRCSTPLVKDTASAAYNSQVLLKIVVCFSNISKIRLNTKALISKLV